MKHPILYRTGMYSCFIVLIAGILFLIHAMNGAPFKSADMEEAYRNGCNFGARPLTEETIEECKRTSQMFRETLDDLDKQMEKLNANESL